MRRFDCSALREFIESDDLDPDVLALAKRLALAYKHLCKTRHFMGAKPFSDVVPVEHQKVFKHFTQAAEIILDIEHAGFQVNPRDYVLAQFEGLDFTGHMPYMSQLHTPAATIRYKNFVAKRQARADRHIQPTDMQVADYETEERKATRMAENLGVSVKRVLRMVPKEFTEAFLRYRGVWEGVRTIYRD